MCGVTMHLGKVFVILNSWDLVAMEEDLRIRMMRLEMCFVTRNDSDGR